VSVEAGIEDLIGQPLLPLRDDWRDPEQAADLETARRLEAEHPDRYSEWAAGHIRWMEPWTALREGDFPEFRYFSRGRMNAADSCVDRWAEDPATAERTAIVWEGEPGDVRTVTYRDLRDRVARLVEVLLGRQLQHGPRRLPRPVEARC